ncbi:MAG: polysaccharide deacetylase family protein [Luteolibacter sp.]|jgi:peptidoglycan/xylan/chitin deacetylase (PgdA/CDA1 family)|nr:polysaccharide deacetylase family protein [Luteolibacter sp.]
MVSFVRKAVRSVRRRFSGTITHVETAEPLVALTFDDGPDPVITPALLKLLGGHGAKATFFMTGEHAAAYPELVAAVRDGGHAIGNHSWDHPSFPLISGRERRSQIRRCAGVLPGSDRSLFRPPYGHQSTASRRDALLTGHEVIAWSVCVPDWEDHDGEWLADFALQRITPGSVVLMHDGMVDFLGAASPGREATLDAVGRILAALHGRYGFITVPELLRRGKAVRTAWWMEPDLEILNSLQRKSGTPRRYALPELSR